MNKRVAITGIGVYSCIGKNVEQVRESLFNGRSGIGVVPERIDMGYRSPLSGIVEQPILKGVLDRRLRTGLGQEGEYAYVATAEALAMASVDEQYLKDNEVGIFYGNDSTAQSVIEANDNARLRSDNQLIGSSAIFRSMNSTVTMNLSVIFKLKGINMTISAACASGSHSVGLGYMFIKNGMQKMVVCGGAQETNIFSMATFDALGAFSMRTDEPTKASRPFDVNRDGLVPSGGAATLILEDYDSAVERGATILAEVVGYGFSSNGEHISQPSDKGSFVAISRALTDAKLTTKDVDYINAHATSTPMGDMYEAMALRELFGEDQTPISSTKSMTGHECWMAGASELVYSTIMMQNSFIAPNINFEQGDEHSSKLNIVNSRIDKQLNVILSNSFGFGGTNSAVIIKKVNL